MWKNSLIIGILLVATTGYFFWTSRSNKTKKGAVKPLPYEMSRILSFKRIMRKPRQPRYRIFRRGSRVGSELSGC